ncbi:phage tail sheath subtilisin-like domain-containing protein [Rhodobacter sp. CZR27]|uniref:phage tail sheath family protein n=1 Tax=Rhodobacter sp. CZR27 TaxID=2033869 RepID=UPI000BBF28BB|nr:phage tail sheath subtilisin-like domain-containing protein [Rhodobacter sp. CZR27]
MYQHPGVYIEHVTSNALAIEAASTSVTAFVGRTRRGARVTASGGDPVFVTSLDQYARAFGPAGGGLGGIRNDDQSADAMGHAVNLYFANGGTKAYIVPVGEDAGTAATASIAFKDGSANRKLTLTANSPGVWANKLLARLEVGDLAGEYRLRIGLQTSASLAETDLAKKAIGTELEVIPGLTTKTGTTGFFDQRVALLSGLVTARLEDGTAGTDPPLNAVLDTGTDPKAPKTTDYTAAFERLRDYRDISIVLLPGQVYKTGTDGATAYDAALTHAEYMQNRLVIIDADAKGSLKTPKDVADAKLPTSPYAVLYHPHLLVANPYHDPDTAANLPRTFEIGPSAAAAGIWARIDATRGVWKAPAGLEATVRGTLGPTILIGNEVQDNLNEWGVNCLRAIIGPTVIWGARTLATKARPQFRYVPVRRTQSMIGESLYRALQAVVFEPNDHKLWGALRASVGDFMDGLHRSGAFQGEKSSDAWFVRCGLGSTMTQGDVDAGIVRVVVGFAPLKPAEFVVVEIQQKVGQSN